LLLLVALAVFLTVLQLDTSSAPINAKFMQMMLTSD
jgi:hypothetical protein